MSYGVRVKKRNRGNLWSSSLLSCFQYDQFYFGIREGLLEVYCWLLLVGGWATFPQLSPVWFNDLAGMAHSWAMWPKPWHLKHWGELGSFLFEMLPCPSMDPWAFPWLWPVVPVPWPADTLWTEAVCPRPVWPLWELGQLGAFLSLCPLPWPLNLGPFGVLPGLLLCPTLVRAAISLAIWFPSSVAPSTGLVVTADLAHTLSWASSFLLSTLWAATIKWEYMFPELLQR